MLYCTRPFLPLHPTLITHAQTFVPPNDHAPPPWVSRSIATAPFYRNRRPLLHDLRRSLSLNLKLNLPSSTRTMWNPTLMSQSIIPASLTISTSKSDSFLFGSIHRQCSSCHRASSKPSLATL